MRPTGPVLTYVGVALAALGFLLIAITWGQVAGLESVALQIPYLVSGGLTGLGLVIVGATAVNVQAKFREGQERERQIQRLSDILQQAMVLLGGEPPADDRTPAGTASGTIETGNAEETGEIVWKR